MNPESPEQPPQDDERDDEAWQAFSAELMGTPANAEGIAAAEEQMRAREIRVRRFEMEALIFKFDDLLLGTPKDFPDRRTLKHLVSAAADLVDPVRKREVPEIRQRQLGRVIRELTDAVKILRSEFVDPTEASEEQES